MDATAASSYVFSLNQIMVLPLDANKLRKATEEDPVLSRVVKYTQTGWPDHIEPEIKPYFNKKTELTVEAGCLLRVMRVVIPESCREPGLVELHMSHPGIVKMKSLACIHVWWPGIDKAIEQLVHDCEACQSVRNSPATTILHPSSWPDRPCKRLHIDFAGPFQGSMFLVLVDSYSKWLEVFPMETTTTAKTLDILRSVLARSGLPEKIVSDNGPQFLSFRTVHEAKQN